MPKLLDVVKESGYSHQDVIDMIEKKKADLPEPQEGEAEVPEEEVVEDDKPEDVIELHQTEVETPDEEEPEDETETIELTQDELDKKIEQAVADKLKANLKVPSKGKIVGKREADRNVVKRNWFEEIV